MPVMAASVALSHSPTADIIGIQLLMRMKMSVIPQPKLTTMNQKMSQIGLMQSQHALNVGKMLA